MAGLVILSSCSSSKNAAVAQREDIKGTWVLDRISYDGLLQGENLRITLLDEGTEECLVGSTWVLPNNGYGTYTIASTQAGCTPGERSIVWSYRKENGQAIAQYKVLTGGVKAKNIEEGYKFKITSASETNMIWQSEITYQSHTIYINYSFSKK